jgi:hypothetical protein
LLTGAVRQVGVPRGGTAQASLTLVRNASSAGRIYFNIAGLPKGVSAVVAPNNSPGTSAVAVTFTAAADAPAARGRGP